MMARFRIRVAGGGEFALDTLDAFVQKVQAGDITPDDLVFDGLTGEWAPARSHPAYQLSADPLVAEDGEGAKTEATKAESPGAGRSEGLIGWADGDEPMIQLVDIEEASPEEEAKAFIARMEQERRAEQEDGLDLVSELTLVGPESGTLSGIMPGPTSPSPSARAPERSGRTATTTQPFTTSTAPLRVKRPDRAPSSARRRWGRWVWWAGVSAVLCVGLAATATVAWSALRTGGAFSSRSVDPATPETRPSAATEASVREVAFDGFVKSIDELRIGLGVGRVPSIWLQGRYLAHASDYPQVKDYWERYLKFVESAHGSEVDLYRNAYLNAAARAGVGGPMRSLRTAGAASDFEADRADRDALYARVWKLAAASLSLHETLLALQGRVSYEPLRGQRVSADPVIEAAGTDPEAQAQLEQALDRVLAAIAPLQNGEMSREGARARAPTWLVDGMKHLETP